MTLARLGGRRFLLTIIAELGILALKWRGGLGDPAFVSALSITVGAFITAEGVQRHIETRHQAPAP